MDQMTYAFTKRKLMEAKLCLQEAPTIYEGLSEAFSHALRWIDPERDMPPSLRSLMRGILIELRSPGSAALPNPRQNPDDDSAVRMLTQCDAERLAASLALLWTLVAAYPQDSHLPPERYQ